jgi:formylglycine-generating enzyme required for sulfatase activity
VRTRPLAVGLVVAIFVALAVDRLAAPGPAAFFIEPTTGMMLVAVEPGTFIMGSPASEAGRNDDERQHEVTISRAFYMGQREVSQAEWRQVMHDNPSHFLSCARCPVEQVTFDEVNDFLGRLNGNTTAMRYRLPTEAEWEYACRAGSTTPFNTGTQLTTEQANVDGRYPYAGGRPGPARERTTPTGSYPANAWGLYDMHGNVWEWTNDWYGSYDAHPSTDPAGASGGGRRVIRGGSWKFDTNSARCAVRYTHSPQDKGFSLGFRIVADPVRR